MTAQVELQIAGVSAPVAAALRDVYEEHGADLVPATVVEVARDPESPLHGFFEWDNTAAAAAYREVQAQNLIRRVHVLLIRENDPEPIKVRAWVPNRFLPLAEGDDLPASGGYRAIEDIAGASDAEAILEAIRRDMARLRRKYSASQEYFDAVLAEESQQ